MRDLSCKLEKACSQSWTQGYLCSFLRCVIRIINYLHPAVPTGTDKSPDNKINLP